MTAINPNSAAPARRIRRRGRDSQILIYLGKQLRFFINESDWKVLPMAAVIAALVTMVIRKRLFQNMEGDLIGAFALTCVAIWNGCFNSIQCVCRERQIVKREHRSGLHISAYVIAHMIYQLLLCVLQTGVTLFVMNTLGDFTDPANPLMRSLTDHLRGPGFMTPWMFVDLGITLLLISYAADMLSLFISSVAHTTTGAMTVMPFVLIFQLVFSGGIIPLPTWAKPLSNFTISTYGIRAITAQADYNAAPMSTPWNTLNSMRGTEIGGTVTLGQVMDMLENPVVQRRYDTVVIPPTNYDDVVRSGVSFFGMPEEASELILARLGIDPEAQSDPVTLGEVAAFVRQNEALRQRRDASFTFKLTLGELIEFLGEDNVRDIVQSAAARASQNPDYDRTVSNIGRNWAMLGVFILLFAFLAMLSLEMIDRDKR